MITKALNAATILIAASPIIFNLQASIDRPERLVDLYSAGLNKGSFSKDLALRAYGPILAAILFRKGMSMVRKVAHV